ncbi:hypothetical protein ACHAXS_010432 [Conticribra weissflogii]
MSELSFLGVKPTEKPPGIPDPSPPSELVGDVEDFHLGGAFATGPAPFVGIPGITGSPPLSPPFGTANATPPFGLELIPKLPPSTLAPFGEGGNELASFGGVPKDFILGDFDSTFEGIPV